MVELTEISDTKYDLDHNIFFNSNDKTYKISAKDALEIAYALFDSVGHSFKELEDIENEIIN